MVLFNSNWKFKGVHAFPKCISPKMNIITQPGFELTFYDVIVQHISQNKFIKSNLKGFFSSVEMKEWYERRFCGNLEIEEPKTDILKYPS